jgi:hypothetical protein
MVKMSSVVLTLSQYNQLISDINKTKTKLEKMEQDLSRLSKTQEESKTIQVKTQEKTDYKKIYARL